MPGESRQLHVLPAYLTTLPCQNLDLVLPSPLLGILCSKSAKAKQPKRKKKKKMDIKKNWKQSSAEVFLYVYCNGVNKSSSEWLIIWQYLGELKDPSLPKKYITGGRF